MEGAYERSGGELDFLLRQLSAASRSLERAIGVAALHKRDETVREGVDRIRKLVVSLRDVVDEK